MKLRKTIKLYGMCIICVLLALVLGCVFIFKCVEKKKINDYTPEPHREYVSSLTEEQHLQNLTMITEEIFSEQIVKGEIVNYKVELVYAFYDNDPEYFLIELEFAKDFMIDADCCHSCETSERKYSYFSKYRHLIGYHNNDKYYYGLDGYVGGKWAFRPGQSPYTYLGYDNEKKFYGANIFGVEKEGEVLCVYSSSNTKIPIGEGCEHNEFFYDYVPSLEQQYQYMKNNYKNAPMIYSRENMSGKFREDQGR